MTKVKRLILILWLLDNFIGFCSLVTDTTKVDASGGPTTISLLAIHRQEEEAKPQSGFQDSVISSSEILADSSRTETPETSGQKVSVGLTTATTTKHQQQQQESSEHKQPFSNNHQLPGDSGDNLDNNNNITDDNNELSRSHYSSSKLLLRLLVVSLFVLVSIALLVLYSIKFCVCRRRKRLMRRNMIADVLADSSQNGMFLNECLCAAAAASSGTIEPVLHQQHHGPLNRLHSLLRSPADPPVHWQLSRDPTSIYQQLSIVDRIALHQLANQTVGLPSQAFTGCSSCLASGDCCNLAHQHYQSHHQASSNRPPAYADLFSIEETNSNQPIVTTTSRQGNIGNHSESQQVAQQANQMSSRSNETSCTNSQDEPSNLTRSSSQKNLLVKLNLNKTKLLSTDDLVLLSKLIDVPIVVHQVEQPVRQSSIQVDGCSGGSDCVNSTMIDEQSADSIVISQQCQLDGEPTAATVTATITQCQTSSDFISDDSSRLD